MSTRQMLLETLVNLKSKILDVEKKGLKLTEQDTRQGLINPLFKSLGWDFSDFNLVRSEFRHKNYNDPVDYAFFNHAASNAKPMLLVEAKTLGKNLNDGKTIKQLCTYLGETGVQWGVLTDGNKYIMYNSNSGASFEDQKFLTMQIKTMDTEDGLPQNDLADKLLALLSKQCLENDEIQKTYKYHVTNQHIENALESLLTPPFETLASAVAKEFKQERVKVDPNLRISSKEIMTYLHSIKGEEGRIALGLDDDNAGSDDTMLHDIAVMQEKNVNISAKELLAARTKRISIRDLVQDKIISEGDRWRFVHKGEVTWGRITGNGELEVAGQLHLSPSSAGMSVSTKPCGGWTNWKYRDSDGNWQLIEQLRKHYRDKHGLKPIPYKKKAA